MQIYSGGGADGSIITFNATELTFEANDGLDDVLADVGPFFLEHQSVISSGDLYVQFNNVPKLGWLRDSFRHAASNSPVHCLLLPAQVLPRSNSSLVAHPHWLLRQTSSFLSLSTPPTRSWSVSLRSASLPLKSSPSSRLTPLPELIPLIPPSQGKLHGYIQSLLVLTQP